MPVSPITSRLTPVAREPDILPLRRAEQLESCFLYWLPVRVFPIPADQRAWLTHWFDCVAELFTTDFGLRGEVFLQYKTVRSVAKAFLSRSREFQPLIGLSRRPGAKLPNLPSKDSVEAALKSGKPFSTDECTPDYCYWFLTKDPQAQQEEFFGYGGVTRIFLKPDDNAKPPELQIPEAMQKAFDASLISQLKGLMAAGYGMKDGFLATSKTLFGADLEDEPQYPGLPFVLPLLSSTDFFSQPEEEHKKWFQLFDVYATESAADQGILLASKLDFEEQLIAILDSMREKFGDYPE